MKKGQTMNPVGYAKYLKEFIHKKDGELFTASEAADAIAVRVDSISRRRIKSTVCQLLCEWTRRGFLLRDNGETGVFWYLGFAKPLPERLTQSEVAEGVWRVLYLATAPMKLSDIYSAIKPCVGKGFRDDVANVLSQWHADKILNRDGKRGQYVYRLTDEARARGTRPPCNRSQNPHPIASDGNMAHTA